MGKFNVYYKIKKVKLKKSSSSKSLFLLWHWRLSSVILPRCCIQPCPTATTARGRRSSPPAARSTGGQRDLPEWWRWGWSSGPGRRYITVAVEEGCRPRTGPGRGPFLYSNASMCFCVYEHFTPRCFFTFCDFSRI